jgi:hypothetical protein
MDDEEMKKENERKTTQEINLLFNRLIEATRSKDELGVARAIKRYNQLQDKVRGY